MGWKDQTEQHFNHYAQNQDGQEYLELVVSESYAETRTDLSSESGSDQKKQRQNKIDGSV